MKAEKNAINGILDTFAPLYCAIFHTPRFRKSFKFFGTSIVPLGTETVQLPAFSVQYPPCLQERVTRQRESKPRFGTALDHSAHDRETGLFNKETTSVLFYAIVDCACEIRKKKLNSTKYHSQSQVGGA